MKKKNNTKREHTKKAASKHGHEHQKNPSKGELNHQKFIALEKIDESPDMNKYMEFPVLLEQ